MIIADDGGTVVFFNVTMTNELTGTIGAASGGELSIQHSIVVNAGTIEAAGVGSLVQLANATIQGGALQTGGLSSAAGAEIVVVGTSILDGAANTVAINADLQVDDGAKLDSSAPPTMPARLSSASSPAPLS